MAKRVVCEMVEDEFTGLTYPTPYSGNCYFTEDSAGLREFKKEILEKRPELAGKLKIMSVKAMEKKRDAALDARSKSPAYLEWKAWKQSTGAVFF